MSDKVKLPREVAEAIEEGIKIGCGNHGFMCAILGNANAACFNVIREYIKPLNGNFTMIMKALVNGYEIEETPEDKVRDLFNDDNRLYQYSHKMLVREILDFLNIKIEGVND